MDALFKLTDGCFEWIYEIEKVHILNKKTLYLV